jgi:hypothetical protein
MCVIPCTLGLIWMRMYSSQSTCVKADWNRIKLNFIPFYSNTCGLKWIHLHSNKALLLVLSSFLHGVWFLLGFDFFSANYWQRLEKKKSSILISFQPLRIINDSGKYIFRSTWRCSNVAPLPTIDPSNIIGILTLLILCYNNYKNVLVLFFFWGGYFASCMCMPVCIILEVLDSQMLN